MFPGTGFQVPFWLYGFKFRVYVSRYRFSGFGIMCFGFQFRVSSFGSRVLELPVSGVGFRLLRHEEVPEE